MKVILMGLNGDACEESIRHRLAPFFDITRVVMIRDGAKDNPWALLDVSDAYLRVGAVCRQLSGVFYDGKRLKLYIPLHQTI